MRYSAGVRTAMDGFNRASGSRMVRRSGESAPMFAMGRLRSRNSDSPSAAGPASGFNSSADATVLTFTTRPASANACDFPAYASTSPAATNSDAAASQSKPLATFGGFSTAIIAGAAAAQLFVTAIGPGPRSLLPPPPSIHRRLLHRRPYQRLTSQPRRYALILRQFLRRHLELRPRVFPQPRRIRRRVYPVFQPLDARVPAAERQFARCAIGAIAKLHRALEKHLRLVPIRSHGVLGLGAIQSGQIVDRFRLRRLHGLHDRWRSCRRRRLHLHPRRPQLPRVRPADPQRHARRKPPRGP